MWFKKNVIFNLALLIGMFKYSYDNVLRWMPQDLTDNKSILLQVMDQCWPRSPTPYGVTRPKWVNGGCNKWCGQVVVCVYLGLISIEESNGCDEIWVHLFVLLVLVWECGFMLFQSGLVPNSLQYCYRLAIHHNMNLGHISNVSILAWTTIGLI